MRLAVINIKRLRYRFNFPNYAFQLKETPNVSGMFRLPGGSRISRERRANQPTRKYKRHAQIGVGSDYSTLASGY